MRMRRVGHEAGFRLRQAHEAVEAEPGDRRQRKAGQRQAAAARTRRRERGGRGEDGDGEHVQRIDPERAPPIA